MDGKMIEEISVEKCVDEDDDWIKFKFAAKMLLFLNFNR
jgi:hypothetical protein